ncbi:MAG: isoprenyl transferase [Candidatus Omnitrophica bacterium]|nr:isoprenyl transferase [Candidatus Omnitrophota bacterium]
MNPNHPQHIAIIMDGNGRWAEKQGFPRIRGHEMGVRRVEEIIRAAQDEGIKYLTLYAFSKENWQRPQAEVSFLMGLLSQYLDQKLKEMKKNNLVFNAIGELRDLPEPIQKKMAEGMRDTRQNTGLVITFAFSYSSRREIAEACRKIAGEVLKGLIKPEEITEQTLSEHLYTANLPDPDLLVRTSGEMRISNFLLWQISYAELYVTEKFWPEFTREEFLAALDAYGKRERRFGQIL